MAIPNITGMSATNAAAKKPVNPMGALDKDTFLKLLVAQLQHQDPTQPTDSAQFMGQMAQFSTVEQLTNLSKNSADAAKSGEINQAVSLLGKTVSYAKADGSLASGKVERVDLSDGNPTLTIAGQSGIAPAELFDVA